MTITTGVDLIELDRIQRLVDRYGDRALDRVYTPAELAHCRARLPELAARFAAKEAVAKALGVGLRIMVRDGVNWHDVETLPDPKGKPVVHLHGRAAARAAKLGLTEWSISLSHGREVAVAFVVAMGAGEQVASERVQSASRKAE
jgi:holo-[acyl-carrier protein] synthase